MFWPFFLYFLYRVDYFFVLLCMRRVRGGVLLFLFSLYFLLWFFYVHVPLVFSLLFSPISLKTGC